MRHWNLSFANRHSPQMIARTPVKGGDQVFVIAKDSCSDTWGYTSLGCVETEIDGFRVFANDNTGAGVISASEEEVVRWVSHG